MINWHGTSEFCGTDRRLHSKFGLCNTTSVLSAFYCKLEYDIETNIISYLKNISFNNIFSSFYSQIFCSGAPPRTPLGAYSAPQTPSWSARHLRWLRHSHIQNLTLISDHNLAALAYEYLTGSYSGFAADDLSLRSIRRVGGSIRRVQSSWTPATSRRRALVIIQSQASIHGPISALSLPVTSFEGDQGYSRSSWQQ